MRRNDSILQDDNTHCFLCGRRDEHLDKHHIFGAANRRLAEEDGLYVWLCHDRCHENGPKAAHTCRETKDYLHYAGMMAYLKCGHTREEFRERYGRYYG